MANTDVITSALAGELRLARGRVAAFEPDGRVRVQLGPAGQVEVVCDVLRIGSEPATPLRCGEEVFVASADDPGVSAVILGTLGIAGGRVEQAGASPAAEMEVRVAAPPGEPHRITHREIVIEAGEELTLKCGEASIRITRDGKIVIRGEHILSRAKGTQRIKGGSVAIN